MCGKKLILEKCLILTTGLLTSIISAQLSFASTQFFKEAKLDQNKKHVHFMHLDGYRGDVFEKMLNNGQLPHFQFLLERGKVSYQASTVDKSETMKVIESYLTSKRNTYVTGWWAFNRDNFKFKNFWIDPVEVINYELGLSFPVTPTIFDFLNSQGKNITAGFSLHRRGVSFENYSRNFVDGLNAISNDTYLKQAHGSMTRTLSIYERIAKNPNEVLPVFSTSLLAAADEMAHLKGVIRYADDNPSTKNSNEICIKRATNEKDRLNDPYEQVFQLLDDSIQKKDQGVVFTSRHFTQVKFKNKSIFSGEKEARKFCISLPQIDTFDQPLNVSAKVASTQPTAHPVLPEYAVAYILIDMEVGRLINTLRSIQFNCPNHQSKCYLPDNILGIEQYLAGNQLEGSLFENTLFIFSGDHGMADTKLMMAKETPRLESLGRDPNSVGKSFIETLNSKLGLNTLHRSFSQDNMQIGIDDALLPSELIFPHKIKHWQSPEIQKLTREAEKFASDFLEELTSNIKDQGYKKYWYISCFPPLRSLIIDRTIENSLSPYQEEAIAMLSDLYLRGLPKYLEAERKFLDQYYDNHVRLIYGGAARNNAELFLPVEDYLGKYSWSKRPSYAEIIAYRNPSSNSDFLIDILKSEPEVGLIFIRKNNGEISSDSELSPHMEIAVFDRFGNRGLITVKQDMETGEQLYSYKIESSEDPLGYGPEFSNENRFRTYNEWNDISIVKKHYYHNVVGGMGSYLYSNNPSIGDITLMRSQGWNFGDNSGGHGGIHREEKLTVMMVSGPGILPGELLARPQYQTKWNSAQNSVQIGKLTDQPYTMTYPTVVDWMPTALNWLGYSENAIIDFTQTQFKNYLNQWNEQQRREFPKHAISIINEVVSSKMPDIDLGLNHYENELKRLFQFIENEKPKLPEFKNFHLDGNQLILNN